MQSLYYSVQILQISLPISSSKFHVSYKTYGRDRQRGGGDGAGEMETRERRSVSIVWLIAENGSREGECLSGS